MLNYRSFSDLSRCVLQGLCRLPADIDVVVGIPRSGLLVATMLALHLNRPLTTLQELIEGRVLSSGHRLPLPPDQIFQSARRIAIVDDSISSGREMERARTLLESAGLAGKVIYVAAYAAAETQAVDVYFELCPLPRVFEWNLMHRPELETACVDIDGVLCLDPTDAQNDDGRAYKQFLRHATPLLRPTYEIGALVTARLERYRTETEAWLSEHGVRYRELIMWDLPSKSARLAHGGHAEFKASVYRARPKAEWFIESSVDQAQTIADIALRPVICLESQAVHLPGKRAIVRSATRNAPTFFSRGVTKLFLRAGRST